MKLEILRKLVKDKNRTSLFLTGLIALGIPFLVNIGNLALIISMAFTLFAIQKKNLKRLAHPVYIFTLLFFVITIISSVYSKQIDLGLKRTDLESLPVFLILIIVNQNITKSNIDKILRYFTLSTLFATILLIVIAVYNYLSGQDNIVFHEFTKPYDQHPVYFSMYISLSLFYLIKSKKTFILNSIKVYKVIAYTIFTLGLLFCASKAVIIIDILLLVLFVLNTKDKKKRLVYILIAISLVILVVKIDFLKERFVDGLEFSSKITNFEPSNDFTQKKQFTIYEKESISDLELRYLFLNIMLYHAYHDGTLLFGYGQGDTQAYINYYYYSYNLGPNWYEGFNIHNQYIHILIMYGIFALILFIAYLAYCFWVAVKHKDAMYIVFLIISSFVFLFEVTLVRNKGIIFFYFFNILFLTKHISIESSSFRNARNS